MPGNEVGERVHNFFPQENLSQGQHHSQVVDGSWPVLGNNLWAGSQRNIGSPSSNSKNYSLQPSDIERGNSNHSFPVLDGLNFSQSTLKHELTKSQSQSLQPNLNGYVYGLQVLQTRQNESNFLGVDTESVRHNITPRGLSVYESRQGNGNESHTTSFGSESSESPVSFNFFGSQQQMGGQQTGMLQSLTQQQSGFHDMQLMQQQLTLRKMQELQKQQEIRQLEARPHISPNQIPFVTEQASGSHSSSLLKGNSISPITEASNCNWATEPTAGNTSWLQQDMPAFQGSTNGFTFSPEQGQSLSSMGLVAQPVDQSLHGVPISNTRGTPHQYSHSPLYKSPVQQMTMYSNPFTGNQCAGFPDQINMQDEPLVSRQGFQGGNLFSQCPSQGVNSGMNLEGIQEVNPLQRNAPVQEFHERQEMASPSETLQEKTEMQMPSSQNVVALDPTEEKILFGDENIWDAFGNSANMGAGSVNPLNVTGIFNGFPSVHSGSWSALMQSAVAESSSNDIGPQEEWSGLSSQNTEVPSGNCQPLTHDDNTKQQTLLGNNHLQLMPALSSGSVPISDHAIVNNGYQGISGFHESGYKFSSEQGDRLRTYSSHRSSVPESPEEGSKWLSRGPFKKPLCEATPIYGNTSYSLDAELNAKRISGSWAPQRSVSSYNAGRPQNKPNGSNVSETISPTEEAVSKIHGNENILQHLHSNDLRRMTHEEISHGGHIWRTDSGPNSTAGLEHSSQVNRNDSSLINIAAIPNASISRASWKNSQLLPSSHQLNYLKCADSSIKSIGSEDSVLEKSAQVLESSINNSDKGAVKMHGADNYDRKENSGDSHCSGLSQHGTTGGSRENVWSDGSDSRDFSGGKQKLSGQAGRKTPGPRKFQYHPMGNLEDERSGGMKHATHSQLMSQQIPRASYSHNQGYFGQSKFFGQFPNPSIEMEKGQSPVLQGIRKGEGELPSRGPLLGSAHNTSASFDRSVIIYAPKKAAQSSQDMLELLHKVDQSKELGSYDGSVDPLKQNQASASQGFGLQLAPPLQRLSFQNRAFASQSSAQSDCSLSLCRTTPEIREISHARLASTAQAQTLPSSRGTSQGEVRTNKLGTTGQIGNDASQHGMRGNFSAALASGFPHSRSWVQNQRMIGASDRDASHSQHSSDITSRALPGQSIPASLPQAAGIVRHDKPVCSGDASQPTDANHSLEALSAPQISVGQAGPFSPPFISSSISQQGDLPKILPNSWTNVPGQQHLFGTHPHKFPMSIFQRSQLNDDVVSTSSPLEDQDDQDARKEGIGLSEFGVGSMDSQGFVCGEVQQANEIFHQRVSSGNNDSAEKMSVSRGIESVVQNSSDASPSNSALTQRDIEAFGSSLKPNNLSHQNYSLLHQRRAIKNSTEIDPSDRGMKRLKGLDSGLGCQIAPKAGQSSENDIVVGDSSHCAAVSSGDSKMLIVTEPADNPGGNTSSQPGNAASQDVLASAQRDCENYSHSNNKSFVRVEHSQISPQMAPSWFNQFGTFKNGHMLSMYDAQKNATIKTMEQQPFTLGKSSGTSSACNSLEQVNAAAAAAAADSDQGGNIWQRSKPTSFTIEDFSFTQSLAEDVSDQHLTVRPKKRKNATSELLPWHKEVTQGSLLLTISIAEVDWAKAANRLIDKLDDQVEMIEYRPAVVRPKRRLILTTQLMQQLFRPPLAAVLSADASSNYETVAYLVAKLALGDACSLIAYSGSHSYLPLESSNLLSGKHKASKRTGDQYLSKVREDFNARARKLENDFLRLDKRASVVDLRIESQDLEKISVINRFARFHGRGQADVAEPSSIFDGATNSLRPGHQKYVTPHPMPRNLLDRVQCLSL